MKARRRLRFLKEELAKSVQAPYSGAGTAHEAERPFKKDDYLKAVIRARTTLPRGI